MTIWVIVLRAVGTLLFLFGVIGGVVRMLMFPEIYLIWDDVYQALLLIVVNFTLVVLCFGGAAALKQLHRIEYRIARMSVRRRDQSEQTRNLAPVAPDWDDLPKPLPYDAGTERRFARMTRLGSPLLQDKYEGNTRRRKQRTEADQTRR